ncbi:MAG: protein kinase domain-containing protein [Erythrobacter sp.]
MSKAYSNRALPAGTVLREWRLEEVLGVGGFGIVYKGRGIYFNELVAIKEYFPSSISERGEDETVVPIDSDAEEVHALGLKKFVEEAKLLWNLSTPTRHPNIVSVRSLFEIHGTAYMVMDFEDGTALSRILKKGRKFNESSLRSMILPIAEGLERAHRVGVLHRDIKPPNIIINDDGRSVLIDFGSARFESGEATSTKVTFHTPPYAAIEQYVRTFPQGPWTDIYALGVVLYECITGEKPAEVLERMHGDAGTPLAQGNWPGFSRGFLQAVDRAMSVRPEDRPQSISEWLGMLDGQMVDEDEDEEDDDAATRIGTWDTASPKILPVAPAKEGFGTSDQAIETGVPDTPSKAEFAKRSEDKPAAKAKARPAPAASEDPPAPPLNRGRAKAEDKPKEPADSAPAAASPAPAPEPAAEAKSEPAPEAKAPKGAEDKAKPLAAADAKPATSARAPAAKASTTPSEGGLPKKAIAGGVAALAVIAIAGWALTGSEPEKAPTSLDSAAPEDSATEAAPITIDAATAAKLVDEARKAGMPRALLATLQPEAKKVEGGPATTEPPAITIANLTDFGTAAVSAAKKLAASVSRPTSRDAQRMRSSVATVEQNAETIKGSTEPTAAVASARELIGAYGQLNRSVTAARMAAKTDSSSAAAAATAPASASAAPTAMAGPSRPTPAATAAASGAGNPVSDRSRREFASAVRGARSVAQQVIRLGDRDRPGSNATEQEQQAFRTRQGAATAARDYLKYLDGLEASMRGNITDADAVQSIAKANQTRGYLSDLLKRSQQTLR